MAHSQLVGPHCNIKSIKRSVDQSNSQTIGIDSQGKPIFKATSSSGKSEDVGLLVMAQGRTTSIEVTTSQTVVAEHPPINPQYPTITQNRVITLKNEVKVTCKSVGFKGMELEIELTNEKTKLSTTVTLNSGGSVNLGGIVSELNSKRKNIDFAEGASASDVTENRQFEYWLEAN